MNGLGAQRGVVGLLVCGGGDWLRMFSLHGARGWNAAELPQQDKKNMGGGGNGCGGMG